MITENEKLLGHPQEEILIVDDDELTLNALEETLKRQGFHLLKAHNGHDAIAIIRSHPVALVICDYSMPGINGIEVLKCAHEFCPDTSRILLTGSFDSNTVIEAINTGQVSHFLVKPWDESLLQTTVKEAIEHYRLKKENDSLQNLILAQHKELGATHELLRREFQLGAHIHELLLVGQIPPNIPGLTIAAMALPSMDIDGDFYEFYHPSPDVLDVVIGDVMGKGIPAALVGTALKTQLIRFALPFISGQIFTPEDFWHTDLLTPKEIIDQVHKAIAPQLIRIEYFVSLFYGRFNLNDKLFEFVDCGSPKPLQYTAATGKVHQLKGHSPPLGMVESLHYQVYQQPFADDDIFVFYSDGISEAKSPSNERFGTTRLIRLVEKNATSDVNTLVQLIKEALIAFTQTVAFDDDITLIVVKISPQRPPKKSQSKLNAQFVSQLDKLKAVRQFVHRCCCKATGDTTKLSHLLQLAINEAFCNIVKHSYKNTTGQQILIECQLLKDGILFQLSDKGEIFDPKTLNEPDFYGDQENGFGWHIIKIIADHIAYIPKKAENGWNHLRLFKSYIHEKESMEIQHTIKENILVITPINESLDAKETPTFKEQILDLVNSSGINQVVFDLSHLQFIDSSGLGCLLSILRSLNYQEGELKLAQITKPIRTMFQLVSLNKIFETFTTTEEAVKSFKK